MKDYILRLKTITIADAEEVGAKNAFLGDDKAYAKKNERNTFFFAFYLD